MIGQTDKYGLRQYDLQGNAFGTFETARGNVLEVHKNPDREHAGEFKYTMLIRKEMPCGEDLSVVMCEQRLTTPEHFIRIFMEQN